MKTGFYLNLVPNQTNNGLSGTTIRKKKMTANNVVEFEAVAVTAGSAFLVKNLVQQFNQFARKSTDNVLEMAKIVVEAKAQLSKTDFPEFCTGIGFDKGGAFISKMKKIGERYDLFKANADKLPVTWTTLYRLATMPVDDFVAGIESGLIHAQMTAKDLEQVEPKTQTTLAKVTAEDNAETDWGDDFEELPKANHGYKLKFNCILASEKQDELQKELLALAAKYGFDLEAA